MSRPTANAWLVQTDYKDARGWQKGKARKHTDAIVAKRICELKERRINEKKYFVGSPYIQMDYNKEYPENDIPSIWYIDEVVRDAGLQTQKPKQGKRKGGSKYLLYPAESIKHIGRIHQSADFVGKKYIAGSSDPVNIFSHSYYAPFKLYQIRRTLAEKAVYAIACLEEQWIHYPVPDVFRVDNGMQFRGTGRGKRCIGQFLRFLLNLSVTPLLGAPRKPWTNPHAEGHNRVFNEKVWQNNFFTNLDQIDTECERFNRESLEYFKYKYAEIIVNGHYRYLEKTQVVRTDLLESTKEKKIYFIRFVESFDTDIDAHIIILNERISLPVQYSHQFVFVEWYIETAWLIIYSESESKRSCIHKIKFHINL